MVLVEAQANGLSLIQCLKRVGIPVTPFYPLKHKVFGSTTNNKKQRARLVSIYAEAGRIWLPARGPNFNNLLGYADKFLNACIDFPSDESNDLVDSMSQALIYLVNYHFVAHPSDQKFLPEIDLNKDKPLY
jgi:phage terminase large subunit-like protein